MTMQSAVHSFSSRRPAAGGLPQFHLPPPNSVPDPQIPSMAIPSPPPISLPPGSRVAERKYLTSFSGVTGGDGLSPLSSGVNSGSSQSSQAATTPYSGSWGPPSSSYTYSSIGLGGPSSMMGSNYNNRPMYSPGAAGGPGQTTASSYASRSSQSPATGELQPPSYDAPFAIPLSGSAGHASSLLSQPPHLQNPILNSQGSQPPTPSTGGAPSDPFSRPPRTPSYYSAPASTPQQTSFPAFSSTQPSPTQASPTTTGPSRAVPPLNSQSHVSMQNHQHFGRPYPTYPTIGPPQIGGAIMSNMGNPGGQMSLMGSVNHLAGYHPHAAHGLPHHGMYGGAPSAQQDRPFRCDVCPQSFNRNHDLKRHKRIHLAVKPYPCEHCEKAFSRKDALKRHRLVKGCGNSGNKSPNSANGGSPSDDIKHEPDRIKHESS
ncbi:hypothetical protein F5Y16DRAFT_87453 [Xylariaceae sp. FL0255]|nr:hypothetical protein F5Y16DRAFT_87453 [Xylariaceae sp. FL0255]